MAEHLCVLFFLIEMYGYFLYDPSKGIYSGLNHIYAKVLN